MTEEEQKIYQEFEERFKEEVSKNKRIQDLAEKLANGTATYKDAWEYANKVGHAGSLALIEQADQLIAEDIDGYETIMDALYDCYDQSATYAAAVQTLENQKAGIGIKGTQADFDRSRASGIAHLGSNAEDAANAAKVLGTPVEHFTENVVGDTIKANEEFQYRSGLSPKIKRTSSGKCCKWCDEVAGIYAYPAPDEVYRRHQNCNCLVEYYPGNGLKQNAHTKRWNQINSDLVQEKAEKALTKRREDSFRKIGSFQSKADPMADAFGPGFISNPEEINAFRQECSEMGVAIIEREFEALKYEPSPVAGKAGQLVINKDASYSAWKHEMQHVYDDRDSGWMGSRIAWIRDDHYQWEVRAYNVEIQLAEKLGRADIAKKLRNNLEEERRRLYGTE